MNGQQKGFEVQSFVVTVGLKEGNQYYCEAKVKVKVEEKISYEVSQGQTVFNAILEALKKALVDFPLDVVMAAAYSMVKRLRFDTAK